MSYEEDGPHNEFIIFMCFLEYQILFVIRGGKYVPTIVANQFDFLNLEIFYI